MTQTAQEKFKIGQKVVATCRGRMAFGGWVKDEVFTVTGFYRDKHVYVGNDGRHPSTYHMDFWEPVGEEVGSLNVTISKERLKELEDKEQVLNALEGAGVDNWEGYDIAMESIWGES